MRTTFWALSLISLIAQPVHSESSNFSIDVVSVEALLVDRATGNFSGDIIGADPKTFVSKGGKYDTTTKSADDVFLRITLKARGDGNIQPPVSVLVLGHSNSPVNIENSYAQNYVVYWDQLNYPTLKFDELGNATITALLKRVTCEPLDVVVHVEGIGGPNGLNQSVALPFECRG